MYVAIIQQDTITLSHYPSSHTLKRPQSQLTQTSHAHTLEDLVIQLSPFLLSLKWSLFLSNLYLCLSLFIFSVCLFLESHLVFLPFTKLRLCPVNDVCNLSDLSRQMARALLNLKNFERKPDWASFGKNILLRLLNQFLSWWHSKIDSGALNAWILNMFGLINVWTVGLVKMAKDITLIFTLFISSS